MPTRIFDCPRCHQPFHFQIGFFRDIKYEKFIHEHINRHRRISAQTTLIGTMVDDRTEVRTSMKIAKEILESAGNFIKPALQVPPLQLGSIHDFTIVGDVQVNGNLYSVPVKWAKGEGSYSINKTSLKVLAKALGDETTGWLGATYKSMVVPQRNPQSGQQVLSFTVLGDSIAKRKGT